MRSIARILVFASLSSALVTAVLLAQEAQKPPAAAPAQGTSSVSIPLTVYDEMRKAGENASATVVDTMTVGGAFHDRSLTMTFAGRSVGVRAAVEIIHDATNVTLSGCSGDALITRAGKGAFELVALAPSFTLKCDVRLSGSDRLQMNVQPSVLAVRSAVTDGELVTAEEDDKGARGLTLVRQVVGTGETLETTATGHYVITLLPDTTRFHYAIQVHNPNRGTSPLPLRLVSNEHLQEIDSAAPYEIKDGTYIFAMPPGDSTINLNGELRGTSFAPPVAASLQYAVLESHPLLRPIVQGTPKRVSTTETGITTQYRGATAFEIGPHERLTWTVTRLEALRAISYAVRSVTHTFFVPANGPILGESNFDIDNQGAPELVIPPKPEPTFVSLQAEPVLMTKNAHGDLTIPLSSGDQQVVVQHRQATPHWGMLVTQLDVPRVPVPATYTSVELRYPPHWLPLWQAFASQASVWRPGVTGLLLFLLLALWLERVLAFLEVKFSSRVAIALILAFASALIPTVAWLTGLAAIFVSAVWFAANRKRWTTKQLVLTALVAGVAGFVGLVANNLGRVSSHNMKYEAVQRADSSAASEAANTSNSNARANVAGFAYQGLPAKFELPSGVRFGSFREQMLAADRPQTVTIVLLSMTLVTWLAMALTLVAAWLLWRERAGIKSILRARMATATEPAAAPATA